MFAKYPATTKIVKGPKTEKPTPRRDGVVELWWRLKMENVEQNGSTKQMLSAIHSLHR